MKRTPSPRVRIHIDAPLQLGRDLDLPADVAHYLRHVMRMNSGDALTVFNGAGGEYTACISNLAKSHAACRIKSFEDVNRELPVDIHIVQCANKGEKIETVLQKGTELGAAGFQVTESERSQYRLPAARLETRLARWRRIIVEAAEQSGRTHIPVLSYRASLGEVILQPTAFALHPEAAVPFADIRDGLCDAAGISLVIGPEGGFSERDLQVLAGAGCRPLCFGPRVMRTETAAPALLAAIAAVL